MSEKRFRANFDVSIYDSETEEYISVSERGLEEIAKRMNEQQSTIKDLNFVINFQEKEIDSLKALLKEKEALTEENEQLRNIIKQKEEEEKLYAKEILRLNELNKQTSEFTDILGGY